MKVKSLLFSFFSLVTILLLIPTASLAKSEDKIVVAQTAQSHRLCVVRSPDASAFPNVTVNFRILDENLNPVTVQQQDLRFSENKQAPVPLISPVEKIASGVGLEYFIIVDKGNRSPQASIRKILQTFAGYFDEKIDKVKIWTDEGNEPHLYYPGVSGNTFAQAISNYGIHDNKKPYQVMSSAEKVLQEIEANPDPCHSPRVIIFIMGDDALPQSAILGYAQRTKASFTKVVLFHISNGNTFSSRQAYEDLAQNTGGIYRQVLSTDDDIKPVLDILIPSKQTYSAVYKTNYGTSGTHTLGATYQGEIIPVAGEYSYTIDVRTPVVSLEGETIITRLATGITDAGTFIFDKDFRPYTARITWQDSYPRSIASNATLVIRENDTVNEIDTPLIDKGDGSFEINWNFSEIEQIGEHKVYVSVRVVDEFGNQGESNALEVTLVNKDQVSNAKYLIYALGGIVVILAAVMAFMWRKMLVIVRQGGSVLGKIAGEIRKTIVGGAKKGKPLATLRILDGPSNMIGQELKLYTESVKLGRDPRLADMTFYNPDVLSSVSGLHARIEKMSGLWRVVALSLSGSETFIDDQPIPFNEPVQLSNGQKIRLGYFAQQPVVFEFFSDQPEPRPTLTMTELGEKNDPQSTVVKMGNTDESPGFFGRPNRKASPDKKRPTESTDSAYDEFRN